MPALLEALWNLLADWFLPPGSLQCATWREYPGYLYAAGPDGAFRYDSITDTWDTV